MLLHTSDEIQTRNCDALEIAELKFPAPYVSDLVCVRWFVPTIMRGSAFSGVVAIAHFLLGLAPLRMALMSLVYHSSLY